MQDWAAGQLRYLIHFNDGGSGMRLRPEPLTVGTTLEDGGTNYRVTRVEHPAHERTFGHAWVETVDHWRSAVTVGLGARIVMLASAGPITRRPPISGARDD
jgi:hypothetical protein